MDEQTREILAAFAAGRLPTQIPDDCEYAEELSRLAAYLESVYLFAMDISNGDLSKSYIDLKGMLAGSLKTLHANLRHLTWQTKRIAEGDLSQRVEFLGDFSEAFNSMVEGLANAREALVYMSTRDGLTGLYNRAYFDTEMRRLAREGPFPASIIVADVNGLKQTNDHLGHEAGDRLIKAAAEVLRRALRCDDVVARIGGDEFAVIMPTAGEEVAFAAVERIRTRLFEINAHEGRGRFIKLSLALGAAGAGAADQLQIALRLADERMYKDKRRQKADHVAVQSLQNAPHGIEDEPSHSLAG